jgi:hypothetical protein
MRDRDAERRGGLSKAARPPAASEIITTRPPRAMTSSTFDSVFSKRSSGGASTITGTLSSMSAIGPCFISPAA